MKRKLQHPPKTPAHLNTGPGRRSDAFELKLAFAQSLGFPNLASAFASLGEKTFEEQFSKKTKN